jgi:integrase
MRRLMGVIKDRHGTYYAQQRVPERLQKAVARVLGTGRSKQVFLKRSLGTKVLKDANVRAKLVLSDFDRIIRDAEAVEKSKPPTRTKLSDAEISRVAEYVYAKELGWDQRVREGGRDELKRMLNSARKQAKEDGEDPDEIQPWWQYNELPTYGLSAAQLASNREEVQEELRSMREALALSDITAVQDQLADGLDAFGINLDPSSPYYPNVGAVVLRAYVRALEDIAKRNDGHPVETPVLPRAPTSTPATAGGTLRNAFDGWEKERTRPPNTLLEYKRAVQMFIELHGDLPVAEIRKSHALKFREALQLVPVPRLRRGPLRNATLTVLSDWGRKHPDAPKVSAGTINKQLGAVQAIAGWAHHNGIIPDDVPWPDPFHRMRLEEEQSSRTSFTVNELQSIFDTALFTAHELPVGAKGAAGVWLPLLALFTGARQAEIAGLQASNIEHETSTPLLFIVADRKAGKRVKTRVSERVIPVHPQLVKLGFIKYVKERAREGERAWLFPTVAPDQHGALSAWSKWFSRYKHDTAGVTDNNKVFHSFRHVFQDALRRATPDEELRDAIQGRSNQKSVSRGYGAKAMLDRWGTKILARTVSKISYPGLDLSRVGPLRTIKRKT